MRAWGLGVISVRWVVAVGLTLAVGGSLDGWITTKLVAAQAEIARTALAPTPTGSASTAISGVAVGKWHVPALAGVVKDTSTYAGMIPAATPAPAGGATPGATASAGLTAQSAAKATPATKTTPASAAALAAERRFNAYITAYTYYDNTPPGSAIISHPILHTVAGGSGTFADPITVAVGHSLGGGRDTLDFAAGTKFYVPNLRRYFVVEDTCGDGATPQAGPCHTGYPSGTSAWLDLWIDGASGLEPAVQACANAITDAHLVIQNPASNYRVSVGPVFTGGACSAQYGNGIVTQ